MCHSSSYVSGSNNSNNNSNNNNNVRSKRKESSLSTKLFFAALLLCSLLHSSHSEPQSAKRPITSSLRSSSSSSSTTEPPKRQPLQANTNLCSQDCSLQRAAALCGSDDVTYRNKCELHQQSACKGKEEITVKYRGECSEEEHRCLEERQQALRTSNESGIPIFVPVCRDDGSYVPVQCHYGTGYCWCVNQEGKPVPNSSIRYDRPNCDLKDPRLRNRREKKKKKGKNGEEMASSTGTGGKTMKVSLRGPDKKTCTQGDRTEFNSHVLDLMTGEFKKKRKGERVASRSTEQNREIVEWKFDQMDVNGDGVLRKREFKTFRLNIKALSRNKVCARNLWSYCDMDADKALTKKEWSTCLGLDANISFRIFLSLSSDEDKLRRKKERARKRKENQEEEELVDTRDEAAFNPISTRGNGGGVRPEAQQQYQEQQQQESSTAPVAVDCRSENRKALESSNRNAYIPACKSDGTFEVVQCYKSSGYCWCVDESNGRPITGTSVQNDKPDCGNAGSAGSTAVGTGAKEWLKCPERRKKRFQEAVVDMITREMVVAADSHSAETELPLEERAAKWKFTQMDANGDGRVTRGEMRPFRLSLLTDDDELKLCGKRIQLHCDPDSDKIVTEEEWLVCVGVKKEIISAPVSSSKTRTVSAPKRTGTNPLKIWLKGD